MPRRWQTGTANIVFHVMNRAARRGQLFFAPSDYRAFQHVMILAGERFGMRLLGYSLMPNHWHLVLWPRADPDLSAYMQWLTSNHVRAWHLAHDSVGTGTLYQARFKPIPVQNDCHFLTLCAYVERNPVRAGLVQKASDWEWGSAWQATVRERRPDLAEWPVPRPADWSLLLDRSSDQGISELRDRIRRGVPYGAPEWTSEMATQLRLPGRFQARRVTSPSLVAASEIAPEHPERPEHPEQERALRRSSKRRAL